MSEIAHDNELTKDKTIYRFHKLVFDIGNSSLKCIKQPLLTVGCDTWFQSDIARGGCDTLFQSDIARGGCDTWFQSDIARGKQFLSLFSFIITRRDDKRREVYVS